jgi:hypothetical protein
MRAAADPAARRAVLDAAVEAAEMAHIRADEAVRMLHEDPEVGPASSTLLDMAVTELAEVLGVPVAVVYAEMRRKWIPA